MLSQANIDKLNFNGLYTHKPSKKYRSTLYADNLYWCYNWVFKAKKYEHKDEEPYYMMIDTYFDDKGIELTDENFDEFVLLFDFNEVEQVTKDEIWDYNNDDIIHTAIGSGGWRFDSKYFVKKGTKKNKDIVLNRLDSKIEYYENVLKVTKETREKVMSNEIDLKYVNTNY